MVEYKVWSNLTKLMGDVVRINFEKRTYFADFKGEDIEIDFDDPDTVLLMRYPYEREYLYESDIFVVKDEYPFYSEGELNYVAILEYDRDGWYYSLVPVSDRVRGGACGGDFNELIEDKYGKLTKIGNLYKNPELFKKCDKYKSMIESSIGIMKCYNDWPTDKTTQNIVKELVTQERDEFIELDETELKD